MSRKRFIFISGIAGFLGSHLAEWALSKGYRVAGCDNLSAGRKENVPPGAEFHQYDLHDLEKNKQYTRDVDVVFHAAALPYDNLSLFSPYQITDHIYTITASLLSAAVENNVKRFVYCSFHVSLWECSHSLHGGFSPFPCDSLWTGKGGGEKLICSLSEVHKFEYVICVFHNIFGIRQIYNDPHRNAVSIIINQMLQDRSPLVYGDGEQTRCFSPVKDVLGLFEDILFAEKTNREIINIGPDGETITINQLIGKLNKIMGKSLQPVYVKIRPGEVKEAVCSSDKARKLLNYYPQVSLEQSLEEMVVWIKNQGPKDFSYNQKIEIRNQYTPEVWTRKIF